MLTIYFLSYQFLITPTARMQGKYKPPVITVALILSRISKLIDPTLPGCYQTKSSSIEFHTYKTR